MGGFLRIKIFERMESESERATFQTNKSKEIGKMISHLFLRGKLTEKNNYYNKKKTKAQKNIEIFVFFLTEKTVQKE